MFTPVFQWVNDIGGYEQLGEKLLKKKKRDKLPTFTPPKVFHSQEGTNMYFYVIPIAVLPSVGMAVLWSVQKLLHV